MSAQHAAYISTAKAAKDQEDTKVQVTGSICMMMFASTRKNLQV